MVTVKSTLFPSSPSYPRRIGSDAVSIQMQPESKSVHCSVTKEANDRKYVRMLSVHRGVFIAHAPCSDYGLATSVTVLDSYLM